MYSIKIEKKDQSKDAQFEVPGLGTFSNGSENEVTDAEAMAYRTYHATHEQPLDEDGQPSDPIEVILGPTLLEAYKNVDGITVKTTKSSQPKLPEGDDK